jgi:hypothetical protein
VRGLLVHIREKEKIAPEIARVRLYLLDNYISAKLLLQKMMIMHFLFHFQCRVFNHLTWKTVAKHEHPQLVEKSDVVSFENDRCFHPICL